MQNCTYGTQTKTKINQYPLYKFFNTGEGEEALEGWIAINHLRRDKIFGYKEGKLVPTTQN